MKMGMMWWEVGWKRMVESSFKCTNNFSNVENVNNKHIQINLKGAFKLIMNKNPLHPYIWHLLASPPNFFNSTTWRERFHVGIREKNEWETTQSPSRRFGLLCRSNIVPVAYMPPWRTCAYLVVTVGSTPVGLVVVATPKSRVVAASLCCVRCGEVVCVSLVFFGKEWSRRLLSCGAFSWGWGSSSFTNKQ